MQRMTYRVRVSARVAKRRMSGLLRQKQYQRSKRKLPQHQRFAKTKKVVQVSGIALLSLPAKSFTTAQTDVPAYERVMLDKTLTIASVQGDSTYFAIDGFQHGFGYDLARSYANDLGVNLELKAYPSDKAALAAVKTGDADMALTTASTALKSGMDMASMNLSCGQDGNLTQNGLNPNISWTFADANDPLSVQASHFICDNTQIQKTDKLADFYSQSLMNDAYSQRHFEKALAEKLPNYQSSFKQEADIYNHDWQLLVAMGYQESHLNANAISPTGVKGLMMLTNSTAKAMGVSNRVDPVQSISGGARYLEIMKSEFADVPNPDRLWFALASYNMGPNAIKNIQKKIEDAGKDGNSWTNVYAYLSDNASSNSRYVQCMHYVSNIRSYLESIKTQTV